MGGKQSRAALRWERDAYTPAALQQREYAELKKEYTRLRDIAQKRLKRMGETEWATADVYRQNVGKYPVIKDIGNKSELIDRLNAISRFVMAERGSVSGLERERRKSVAALKSHGYTFVTKENFRAFAEFMGWAKATYGNKAFSSERVYDVFEKAYQMQTPPEVLKQNFLWYYENIYSEEFQMVSGEEEVDSKKYSKIMTDYFGMSNAKTKRKKRRL